MENPPFEDVFPIQDGDFALLCLFTGVYSWGGNSPLDQIPNGLTLSTRMAHSSFINRLGFQYLGEGLLPQ